MTEPRTTNVPMIANTASLYRTMQPIGQNELSAVMAIASRTGITFGGN